MSFHHAGFIVKIEKRPFSEGIFFQDVENTEYQIIENFMLI
jgi:hypothetical protein